MDTNIVRPAMTVTDWFFYMVGGHRLSYTLLSGDKVVELKDRFEVRIKQTGEKTTIYKVHLFSTTKQSRAITVYPKGESPAEKTIQAIVATEGDEMAERRKRFDAHRRSLASNPVKEQ